MADIKKQLWENQLWETVGFAAKAGFLFLLTPVMIRKWGLSGYGEFAVASSAIIFFSVFDFGLRGRARIAICQLHKDSDPREEGRLMAFAITRFVAIAGVLALIVNVVAHEGVWSRLLNLAPNHDFLIVVTAVSTHLYMISGFFLEPLVAQGRIGSLKLSNACGAIIAIPTTWLVIVNGGSVAQAIAVWIGCLTLANVSILFTSGYWREIKNWGWSKSLTGGWKETFLDGIWFNITNVNGLLKNQYLVFLISAVSGTATAGIFFVIVRLSEIISSFGAISCDVGLGALSTGDLEHRRNAFSLIYGYSVLLCLVLALGIGLITPFFWQFWLHTPAPLGGLTGWLAAALGLTAAINRIIVYAALPLGMTRFAAFWSVLEIITVLTGALLTQRFLGLGATILLSSLTVCILFPVAHKISKVLEQPFWKTWNPDIHKNILNLTSGFRRLT